MTSGKTVNCNQFNQARCMQNKMITFGIILAVFSLCLNSIQISAQDEGGPGGPPPSDFEGGGGPGGMGGLGGPAPSAIGSSGNGQGRNFDPAQFQQRMLEQVRQNLNITNAEEWSAIKPLFQKVIDAQREVRNGSMGGPPGGPRGRSPSIVQSSAEQQTLQKAVEDNSPVQQIKDALAKYRAARQANQARLEAAQDNLKAVLSTRQEAQAVLLGLLP